MDNFIEQNAAGVAYAEIKRLIILKKLKPGQRLAEISLSKTIGVSRTPVREALRRLTSEGWLNMVQNSGVWVSSPTKREMLDAYEVRGQLETWGITKAMPNVTPLLIRRLEECIEEEKAIYGQKNASESYPDVNMKFHLVIAEAGGNDALCQHLKIALSKTLIYMILYENYLDFDNNCSLSEHESILESIKAMDQDSVIAKMNEHINNGFRDLHL